MSDIAVKIENLSKQYRLGLVGSNTLRGDLQAWWYRMRGKEDPTLKIGEENKLSEAGGEFIWALRDINLEVKKGEVLGIIGKNGAGKSTLLKILSRVTGPTTGNVKINGSLSSLLEVGTGFHPELTGKENIFLNGAILGMTKPEIRKKIDDIVDFAGVAKFIDTPVKRYSSGMRVRLGFAVAAFLEPDILVVDEVLAVGDAEFQKRAIGKMQDVSKGEGRTVLFVSHNMGSVKALCTRAILLENGKIIFKNNPTSVIDQYLKSNAYISKKYNFKPKHTDAYVQKVTIENSKNEPENDFLIGEPWQVRVRIKVNNTIDNLIIGIGMSNSMNISIRTTWGEKFNAKVGIYEIIFIEDEIIFSPDTYQIHIGLSQNKHIIDYISNQIFIRIGEAISPKLKFNIIDKKNGIFFNHFKIKYLQI